LPSSHDVFATVMKNWLPPVWGPAFAIETTPGPSWRNVGWNSSLMV
jgi:hypothetical protein